MYDAMLCLAFSRDSEILGSGIFPYPDPDSMNPDPQQWKKL
jgi:hypothetical protein